LISDWSHKGKLEGMRLLVLHVAFGTKSQRCHCLAGMVFSNWCKQEVPDDQAIDQMAGKISPGVGPSA
jgi:hypothetical protein